MSIWRFEFQTIKCLLDGHWNIQQQQIDYKFLWCSNSHGCMFKNNSWHETRFLWKLSTFGVVVIIIALTDSLKMSLSFNSIYYFHPKREKERKRQKSSSDIISSLFLCVHVSMVASCAYTNTQATLCVSFNFWNNFIMNPFPVWPRNHVNYPFTAVVVLSPK
jgi:hypothetical protein